MLTLPASLKSDDFSQDVREAYIQEHNLSRNVNVKPPLNFQNSRGPIFETTKTSESVDAWF